MNGLWKNTMMSPVLHVFSYADFLMTARLSKLVDAALGLSPHAKNVKSWARHNAFGAPPSPQGAAVSQELDDLPNPFEGEAESSSRPPICAAWVAVAKDPRKKAMRGVHCDVCGIHLHLHCADLLFPPRHAS